ncbi:permease-like cell division protein FtsX [Fictibacillus phosphorivorans]|uniref:permease-like cell division protein FtsX n=1 Tax=Fictibacillus phosphorivorans TaxID=1221500 RepID=UPI00203FDE75|nr:permease-like cell division protein FtsX [Fictibacillus phosphorivorans]MCM3720060.1 permease-like cell division protein FtsX [Fictibacillus phosphorivorans]MCM3777741.1 permease-like cell division protein FtsX [Fictibacillus phosphorivorans]
MKIRTLKRHLVEAFKSMGRNGWMSFASISAVTVTLLLVSVFVAILLNINYIASQIEDDVQIRAYIERTEKSENYDTYQKQLENLDKVKTVKYQSKEQGLDELIESLGDEGKAFSSLKDENPLRDAFIIYTEEPQDTAQVAKEVDKLKFVNKVEYGQGTVEKLFKVTDAARNVGIVLVLGLVFTAMFLISNTIKLTIVTRRREIEIMKLVGATNGFIRWPFFIEGFALGVMGAILPIIVIAVGYQAIFDIVNQKLGTVFIELLPVTPLIPQLSLLMLLIGGVIGVWGSLTSVRKFLKI